jgi:hypothetical protein
MAAMGIWEDGSGKSSKKKKKIIYELCNRKKYHWKIKP